MSSVSQSQAIKFQELLEEEFLRVKLPKPLHGENEVSYTSRVMYPRLLRFVQTSFTTKQILVKGDGGPKKSTPVPLLDGLFRPDLSVEEESTKVWAGEVKLVTARELSGILAKAIGQGVIYSTKYLTTDVMLIVRNGNMSKFNQVLEINPTLRLLILGVSNV
jgi:hypothetical protein